MGDKQSAKPLGIRSTLWLAIALTVSSTMLGAGALHGYQLYLRSEAAEGLRIRTLASAYAAQAALWLSHSRDEMNREIDRLAWHPDVCVLAVVTPAPEALTRGGREAASTSRESQIIKVRGDRRLVEAYLASPAAAAGTPHLLTLGGGSGARAVELYLIAAPMRLPGSDQPLAVVICGARAASPHMVATHEVAIFFARLLVAACAGAILGFWWLRRSVVLPLSALASRSSSRLSAPPAESLSHCGRDDEIGDVARALEEMHIDLEEWRNRAARLERNVNQRVASETQRVSRELQQAKRKIWTDSLTGLGNRRLLEDRFEELFAAQRQAGDDISVVMIDIDNFKKLNDSKGHPAGDEILRFIGELLKQSLREEDLAIRYGGDEFILLLPAVTLRDAERVAQRTVLLFNQQAKLLSIEPKPSMSAGIASLWEHHPETAAELLAMADSALYAAKRAGKARVGIAKPRERVTVHAN